MIRETAQLLTTVPARQRVVVTGLRISVAQRPAGGGVVVGGKASALPSLRLASSKEEVTRGPVRGDLTGLAESQSPNALPSLPLAPKEEVTRGPVRGDLTGLAESQSANVPPSLRLASNSGGPAAVEIVSGSAGSGNEVGRRWTQEAPGGGRTPPHAAHERRPA
jgi:hypothetical protein